MSKPLIQHMDARIYAPGFTHVLAHIKMPVKLIDKINKSGPIIENRIGKYVFSITNRRKDGGVMLPGACPHVVCHSADLQVLLFTTYGHGVEAMRGRRKTLLKQIEKALDKFAKVEATASFWT